MNNEFFLETEKMFCDNAKAVFSPESFLLSLASGEEIKTFAFTPQHMKRLVQHLEHTLKQYETHHGEIKAKWEPGVQSPLQIDWDKSGGNAESEEDK